MHIEWWQMQNVQSIKTYSFHYYVITYNDFKLLIMIDTDHKTGTAELKIFNSSSIEILRNNSIDRTNSFLIRSINPIRHKWPALLQRFCFNSKKAWKWVSRSRRAHRANGQIWKNLKKDVILRGGGNRQCQRFVILKKITVSSNAVPLRQTRTNKWSCFWKRT